MANSKSRCKGPKFSVPRQARKALKKFNEVKKELEEKFPTHELSVEEKSELLQRSIIDSLVKHNSLKPERKKSAARSTRTFG